MFKKILLSTVVSFIAVSSVQAMEDDVEGFISKELPNTFSIVHTIRHVFERCTPEVRHAIRYCDFREIKDEGEIASIVSWLGNRTPEEMTPEKIMIVGQRLGQLSSVRSFVGDFHDYRILSIVPKLRVDQLQSLFQPAIDKDLFQKIVEPSEAFEFVESLVSLSADETRRSIFTMRAIRDILTFKNPTGLGVDVTRNLKTTLKSYTPEAFETLLTSLYADSFKNEMSAEGRCRILTSLAVCSPVKIGHIVPRLPEICSLLPKDGDRVDYTLISALADLRDDQIWTTLDNLSRLLPQGMDAKEFDAKEFVASLIPLSEDEIRAKASQNSNQN